MAKFVEFIDGDGVKVSVNVDLVTKVGPSDRSGTHIAFGKDRGVTVKSDYQEVMEVLRSA